MLLLWIHKHINKEEKYVSEMAQSTSRDGYLWEDNPVGWRKETSL